MELILKTEMGTLLAKYEITKFKKDQVKIIFYTRENYSTGPEWYQFGTYFLPKQVLKLGLQLLEINHVCFNCAIHLKFPNLKPCIDNRKERIIFLQEKCKSYFPINKISD